MSFAQFISILRARRAIALSVLLVTLLVTLLVSLLLPKQYLASASVVVDNKADPIGGVLMMQGNTPTFIATQIDVIQSDRVALRVVRNLKLDQNPTVREQWLADTKGEGSLELWLAESFQKRLVVKPSRDSNVMMISYQAPDPKFAAGLANAFVQAYLETALELRVDPAKLYSSFFDTRSKEARAALEEAQSKLSAYQKETGIIATDERLDVESSRLTELSSQLVGLQAVSSDSGSRAAQISAGPADRLPEVLNSALVASLKGDIARNEARLQELNARLGDSHPLVLELRANIADTRAKLDVEIKRVTGSISVNNSVNKQRESELRAALEAQRNKVLRMKAIRDDQNVLVKDVENAQRAYDAVNARLTQSSLESQTNQSNVSVLTTATPPLQHSSPRLLLNMALASVIGLLLAIGAAFATETLDRRVRSHEDIAVLLGLPVLGVMPAKVQKRRWGARLVGPGATQQRFLGGLTPNAPKA